MDTPLVVLASSAAAVLLFVSAIISERLLQRRRERRGLEADASDPAKRDAADAVIEALNRTSDMVRQVRSSTDPSEKDHGA